ncbi:MAG TPA: sulfurtransferase TusA family protein [Dehalococcoidia bacterium]|nr:sulfurtransferase TusA family protein [Dehalococcoidia bacterium]
MTINISATLVLDTSGEYCPMPVVKAKLAIDSLSPGDVLEVIATDPGSWSDFPGWANTTGNKLLEAIEEDGKFVFYLEKA